MDKEEGSRRKKGMTIDGEKYKYVQVTSLARYAYRATISAVQQTSRVQTKRAQAILSSLT